MDLIESKRYQDRTVSSENDQLDEYLDLMRKLKKR